ncbi:MAG: glutaredoxin 3 [Panacagrimonas sp.]
MKPVRIYSTAACPYCIMAKRLLDSKGVSFEDLRVDHQPALRQQMSQITGRWTVPQIFIGDTHVGGYDDMWALECAGELDRLLQS